MDVSYIRKIWKSRVTVLDMLIDRGYNVSEDDRVTYEEFEEWVGDDDEETIMENMTVIYERPKNKIYVTWIKGNLGTVIKNIVLDMKENECTESIIVISATTTNASNEIIKTLWKQKTYIWVFNMDYISINISKHSYVPKHEICSVKETKRLKNQYSVENPQIPKILADDPMVRYLGAVKGQLIRITRNSDTQPGNKVIYYRIVK